MYICKNVLLIYHLLSTNYNGNSDYILCGLFIPKA